MNLLIPENSYTHKCSCGTEFLAPKGAIHCHWCLYKGIAELEKRLSHAETESTKERDVNNLRQQAKGVRDAIGDFADNNEDTQIYVGDLVSRVGYLKNQADELEKSE